MLSLLTSRPVVQTLFFDLEAVNPVQDRPGVLRWESTGGGAMVQVLCVARSQPDAGAITAVLEGEEEATKEEAHTAGLSTTQLRAVTDR
jgi:hypothetical protein